MKQAIKKRTVFIVRWNAWKLLHTIYKRECENRKRKMPGCTVSGNLVYYKKKVGDLVSNAIITDMSGSYIEHSEIITNFVAIVYSQLKGNICRVYPDNVQYKWMIGNEEKIVIPDASINCRVHAKKGNSFFDIPRFVMEVLSPSTEKYDRTEKMELYRQQEIDEYWIVDWRKRQVEIYTLDYDSEGNPEYYLFRTVTEENKNELCIVHFPHIKITFEELFNID